MTPPSSAPRSENSTRNRALSSSSRSLSLLHTHARPPDPHALCRVAEDTILAGTVMGSFFRKSGTENVAETGTPRDVPLDMPHALRAGAFGIVFALLGSSDPAEDGAACSVGEVDHGKSADY